MNKFFSFFDEIVKIASFVFSLWGKDYTVNHIDFDEFQSSGYSDIKSGITDLFDVFKKKD